MNADIAGLMGRIVWQLVLYSSGTTALRVVNGVRFAGSTFLGVRASLIATLIGVYELDVGILVDGDLEVADGSLLLRDVFTAGNLWTFALGDFPFKAIVLRQY